MSFVVDASVVAAWGLADESSDAADHLFVRAQNEGALIPNLLWYEVRNILLMAERRERILPRDADEFLSRFDKLPLTETRPAASRELMRLARSHTLTAYDAAYLELALREHVSLATFDRKLAAAAVAEGLPLIFA